MNKNLEMPPNVHPFRDLFVPKYKITSSGFLVWEKYNNVGWIGSGDTQREVRKLISVGDQEERNDCPIETNMAPIQIYSLFVN